MQEQLFATMQDQLWDFCQSKKLFSTNDIYEWGVGKYTRSCRTVREWAEEGLIRRLAADEMIYRGLRQKGRAPVQWFEVK